MAKEKALVIDRETHEIEAVGWVEEASLQQVIVSVEGGRKISFNGRTRISTGEFENKFRFTTPYSDIWNKFGGMPDKAVEIVSDRFGLLGGGRITRDMKGSPMDHTEVYSGGGGIINVDHTRDYSCDLPAVGIGNAIRVGKHGPVCEKCGDDDKGTPFCSKCGHQLR
ncbi:hypothetical protein ACFL2R_01630 [Patescibacteria group bacterium]